MIRTDPRGVKCVTWNRVNLATAYACNYADRHAGEPARSACRLQSESGTVLPTDRFANVLPRRRRASSADARAGDEPRPPSVGRPADRESPTPHEQHEVPRSCHCPNWYYGCDLGCRVSSTRASGRIQPEFATAQSTSSDRCAIEDQVSALVRSRPRRRKSACSAESPSTARKAPVSVSVFPSGTR